MLIYLINFKDELRRQTPPFWYVDGLIVFAGSKIYSYDSFLVSLNNNQLGCYESSAIKHSIEECAFEEYNESEVTWYRLEQC